MLRRAFSGSKPDESINQVLDLFSRTRSNGEFVSMVRQMKWNF